MIKAASNIAQQTDSIPITNVANGNTASAGNGNNRSFRQAFIKKKKKKAAQPRSLYSLKNLK